jgi:hypothetical protein
VEQRTEHTNQQQRDNDMTNEQTEQARTREATEAHNAAIDAMSKKELVAMAIEAGTHTKSAANKATKADLAAAFHVEQTAPRRMKDQMAAYRGGYTEAVSASGNKSLHNGDDTATTLAGMEPEAVVALAEAVLGMETGSLWAKYQNLNKGQQRMNAGNRIRNAIKRGDINHGDIDNAAATMAAAA